MGLAWEVSPEVERYDEAVDWFRKRTVLTAKEAHKLDDDKKADAFWVGGGLQLAQVQRVFDHAADGIERGDTLETFKQNVRGLLKNSRHVQTVYRNAVQRAYNAGRYTQMKEEHTAKFRPFWLFDAVLDAGTTPICRICNGVILPHEAVWWDGHTPPLHHECRSSIRNLTRKEALKRGISEPPDERGDPQPGFGQSPKLHQQWKPDPKKHDKQLLLDLGEKSTWAVLKRKPNSVLADEEPKLELQRWVDHYTKKYGDAAKSLGHGRAALELGLDLPVRVVREQLKKLDDADADGIRSLLEACEDCDAERTLREQGGELDPLRKAAAGLAGHLRTLPARETVKQKQLDYLPGGERVMELFSKISGPSVKHVDDDWKVVLGDGAGGYTSAKKKLVVYDGAFDTLAHELGHVVEDLNPVLFARAVKFLRVRRGKQKRTLLGVTPEGVAVMCWKDGFLGTYTGRDYGESKGAPFGTEITSTAIELLVAGDTHWGSIRRWLQKDPEHFLFLLGQLAGP